jgi:hypothetical protein
VYVAWTVPTVVYLGMYLGAVHTVNQGNIGALEILLRTFYHSQKISTIIFLWSLLRTLAAENGP